MASGYVIAVALFLAAQAVGACGWGVVATGFGGQIDWRRLRLGGAIIALALIAVLAGAVFLLVALLADVHISDYRDSYRWDTAGALLIAAGTCIVVTGFADSRRGASRAQRLWLGSILVTAGYGAHTFGMLFLQSFYSSAHAVHEVTIGTLVVAIGSFGLTLAGVVFVFAARRALVRREAALFAAALLGAAASLCLVAGNGLLAIAYDTYGGAAWQIGIAWLEVASDIALAAFLVTVALGARAAARPAPA